MQNPSATTNYNFNLPATAGNSGELLTSSGGGSSPETWTAIGPDLSLSGGALNLGVTAVTPGTYALSTITVDAKGRLTAASNGPSTGTVGHVLPYLDGGNTWSGTQTFASVVGKVTTQAGASYTLAVSDCGTTILFTGASSITLTTLNSLPVGCAIAVEQAGPAGEAGDPSANLYRYARDNPLVYVDPRGDQIANVAGAAAGFIGGVAGNLLEQGIHTAMHNSSCRIDLAQAFGAGLLGGYTGAFSPVTGFTSLYINVMRGTFAGIFTGVILGSM